MPLLFPCEMPEIVNPATGVPEEGSGFANVVPKFQLKVDWLYANKEMVIAKSDSRIFFINSSLREQQI